MGESSDLRGIVLPDAIGGGDVDLGREAGPTLLILIRHRH
jgi:hypothetical protein